MSTQGKLTNFIPESYLPEFVYTPLFIKEQQLTYTADQLAIENNSDGIPSIIRLVDNNNEKIIPFIDVGKYDSETKDWYYYDQTNLLPHRFTNKLTTYQYAGFGYLQNMYPTDNTNLTYPYKPGPLKYDDTDGLFVSGVFANLTREIFLKYAPIILVGDNVPFVDMTDYSTAVVTDNLDRVTTNGQFYYDFNGRIFTNKNLSSFSAQNLKLKVYVIGTNEVSLKCSMQSNSGSKATYTPVIKDYVLKLKGQFLR